MSDYSEWKTSKAIADTMLCCMLEANSMVLIGNSKLSLLKGLITVLTVYEDSVLESKTYSKDFPSDDHGKKRSRAQRTQTSLSSLMETEQTFILMCILAIHWNSWVKVTKDADSQLSEMRIHLLAFISLRNQCLGEAPSLTAPLYCPPILKDEFDCCNKPSFVNSRNGWFALSPLGCVSKPKLSGISATTALVIKGFSN